MPSALRVGPRVLLSQSEGSKAYTLGPTIWQLASQMRQSNPLLQVAREHVAAPVRDFDGQVVAAIGISAPSNQLTKGRLNEVGE